MTAWIEAKFEIDDEVMRHIWQYGHEEGETVEPYAAFRRKVVDTIAENLRSTAERSPLVRCVGLSVAMSVEPLRSVSDG